MLYRIFLYKTLAVTGSAPAIDSIHAAIKTDTVEIWEGWRAADSLCAFDTDAVIAEIENALTNPITKKCACHARCKYPPSGEKQIGYICVATSYAEAEDVLQKLYAIAIANGLVLYDAETEKTFWIRDWIDRSYITMQNRQQTLRKAIFAEMQPLWRIRCLSVLSEERDKSCSYVVTLQKEATMPFTERTKRFFQCLSDQLLPGEELRCAHEAFTIVGEWYTITYVLEGYKKHADRVGYRDASGCFHVDLLHRMSADEAYRRMEMYGEPWKSDVFCRMNFLEMENAYPNPAARFVAAVKINDWQKKQVFSICYSGIGPYGSEFLFHVVPSDFCRDSKRISVLKIEEDSASFILPFIEDVYPDIYERYYLTKNYLPREMWERILDRLEEAKKMILQNAFDPALAPYIEKFDLYVLRRGEDADGNPIGKNRAEFLHKNRYKVAHFYDVFIRWSRAQINHYCDNLLFNIQGP